MVKKATKIILCLCLFGGIILTETQAQVLVNTGKIGVRLSSAGSIRLITPSTDGTRQIDRINIIAALSEKAVCDYNEDQDVVNSAYQVATPAVADIEAFADYDNNYSNLPPNVRFKLHLYGWNDEPYFIARFTVINDTTDTLKLYLGTVFVPRIAGNYGGETNSYSVKHKLAYTYRTGETPHAGVRLLSKDAYSYHALDWADYSPADPNADAATDSIRYHQTADEGFDADITAGGDGSLVSLNAGKFIIAPGDSTIIVYAVIYAESANDLLAASDAAQAKYDAKLVGVEKDPNQQMPVTFSLAQNYPNPFNPATTVRFDLTKDSEVSLAIYNLQGEMVNTIARGNYTAGSHSVTWNGKDRLGNAVGSGIYIYRLNAGNVSLQKKMLLVH